jgi:formate/nitrite transporter FocA (FNT family)
VDPDGPDDKGIILPHGAQTSATREQVTTERGEERGREDERFTPVIVKRTDEARRHPDDVLEVAIQEGAEQLNRPLLSLALSSVTSGLILGFTAMSVAIMTVAVAGVEEWMLRRFATALVYPLGFVLCLMSGTELFTEHTATAVYPVLDRRASLRKLLRLWLVVAGGNLLGTLASAGLLRAAEPVINAGPGYVAVAEHLVTPGALPLLFSALLAGWLMALGAWLILATPPTFSQIMCIYIATFLIGFGGLHHSIAGAAEMFAGLFMSEALSVYDAARFLGWALLGNLIGGSLFVAVLNYGHIRQTRAVGRTRNSSPT